MDKSYSKSKASAKSTNGTNSKNVNIESTNTNTNTKNLPTVTNKNKNVIINDEELFGIGKQKSTRGRKSSSAKNDDLFGLTTTTTTITQNPSQNLTSTSTSTHPTINKLDGGGKNPKSKYVSKKIIEEQNDNNREDNEEDNGEDDNGEDENAFKKNGYTRPDITYTDQLSKDQIEKKLEDYKKVDDIYKVPLGVHLRYFSNIDGKMVFRMGGQLYKNTGLPAYVILTNGKNQWSTQIKDTIFYRKMVLQEIKEEYELIINGLLEKNKKLKEKIAKYEK